MLEGFIPTVAVYMYLSLLGGQGRQGHVQLREHPGLDGAPAGGAGVGGSVRCELRVHRLHWS